MINSQNRISKNKLRTNVIEFNPKNEVLHDSCSKHCPKLNVIKIREVVQKYYFNRRHQQTVS